MHFSPVTTVALFILRKQEVGGEDVYRMPLYPWLPGLYLAGILTLLVIRAIFEWEKSLMDLAFIATGLPFALIWVRKRKGSEPSTQSGDSSTAKSKELRADR